MEDVPVIQPGADNSMDCFLQVSVAQERLHLNRKTKLLKTSFYNRYKYFPNLESLSNKAHNNRLK